MAGPSQSFSCQKLQCSTTVGILVYGRLYIEQCIEQKPNIQQPALCRRETGVPQSCFRSYCEGQRADLWLPGHPHPHPGGHIGFPQWQAAQGQDGSQDEGCKACNLVLSP